MKEKSLNSPLAARGNSFFPNRLTEVKKPPVQGIHVIITLTKTHFQSDFNLTPDLKQAKEPQPLYSGLLTLEATATSFIFTSHTHSRFLPRPCWDSTLTPGVTHTSGTLDFGSSKRLYRPPSKWLIGSSGCTAQHLYAANLCRALNSKVFFFIHRLPCLESEHL